MHSISFSSMVSALNPFSALSNRNFSLSSTTRKLLGLVYIFGMIGSVVSAAQNKPEVDTGLPANAGTIDKTTVVWNNRQKIYIDPDTDQPMRCLSLEIDQKPIAYSLALKPYLEKVVNCPAALKVLKEVREAGSLTVLKGDQLTAPAGGSWRQKHRLIAINPKETEARKLGHLLFELTDALQHADQKTLFDDCDKGLVSQNDYVMRWQKIQYQASKRFASAVKDCINKYEWPKAADLDIPLIADMTWEEQWAFIQRAPKHLDLYRREWDLSVKKDYCPKHPVAPECKNFKKAQ